MKIIKSAHEMHAVCDQLRCSEKRLALVPTMGALHQGHLSLVRIACAHADVAAVSIFVNPLQFGPKEDYAKYPRSFERDCQLLESEKVDYLFAPSVEEMYPPGSKTVVEVQELSERLCGRSRPGHFRGVTTVVSKLFNIMQPDIAVFGAKDVAQVAIIQQMVRDLNFPVRIVVAPIVREADGLAMSSRNGYLDLQQRKSATVLYRALSRVQTLADKGERRASRLIEAGKQVIAEQPGIRLDYLEIVDPQSLEAVADVGHGALVAVAAFVGDTRLIDNMMLTGGGKARGPAGVR